MAFVSALQIPYRESRDGFWGEQTSTLNWCEEDYNITFYCAEVVNTLTNLVFMYLGLKGLRNVLAYSHSRVFILVYLGYLVVGLGSMAFHTTLKYEMQLADELPMIYTVCIMAFATFSYRKSVAVQVLVAAAMAGVAVFITVYYLYAKDPVFHQVAYGLLTVGLIFRGFFVMERDLRPQLSQRNPAECDRLMREMYKLAVTGILTFLAGFVIWNIDNIFCHHLTTTKKLSFSVPSATLRSEMMTTAMMMMLTSDAGAYHLILWRVWLNRCLDGSEKDFMLDWTPLRSVPQVVPRPGAAVDGALQKKTQ
ncbi:c804d4db-4c73-4ac4-840f-b0914149d89c [Thermothielavioides terrestris]|uniref:C804d4db-4c73-4ac4-840f-b0914149d89c n=1 Tax=Thermothielavioides terrestris TaxID=2587410 RepID=A0A446BA03_9PEZI|nr:c804d4db-4c73-4ac4-840f-b0914149d89c [Thermothielavioides terrestris]